MILSEAARKEERGRLATHARRSACLSVLHLFLPRRHPRAARFDSRKGQTKTETATADFRDDTLAQRQLSRGGFRLVSSPRGVLFRPFLHILANATTAEPFRRPSQGSSSLTYKTSERASMQLVASR